MDKFSRRSLIKRSLTVLGAVAAAPLVSACSDSGGGSLTCTDTTGLSEPEKAARTALHYADASPHGAAKNCLNCQYYTAGAANACGACQLVKGPIHPSGYCDSWTAKS